MSENELEGLRACPFCGGGSPLPMMGDGETYWMRCAGCEVESSVCNDGPTAIQHWNTRATDAAIAKAYQEGFRAGNTGRNWDVRASWEGSEARKGLKP